MAIAKKLQKYLEEEKVRFSHSRHETAYTAQETAGVQHVPGQQFVKSILVKGDGKIVLCVLSANHLIDFDKLKALLKVKEVELADETAIGALFPDYEIGAMPPFGHQQGLKVYADNQLLKDKEIVFNAGTHTDVIKIALSDFKRLENPVFADFGIHI